MANALNLPIPVPVSDGGTGSSSLTVNSVLIGNGTSDLLTTSLTAGQLLVGTGAAPQGVTLTQHGVVIGEGASSPNTVVLGQGQVLIGQASADPIAGTISAVTSYQTVTTATQLMVSGTLYYINDTTPSEQVVLTLPASPTANDIVAAVSLHTSNTAGWQIQAGSGQTIQLGQNISSVAGTLTSTSGSSTDSVFLIYAATGLWVVYDAVGLNMTLA